MLKEMVITIAAFAVGAITQPVVVDIIQDSMMYDHINQLVRDGSYDEPVPRHGHRRSSPEGRDVAFYGLQGEPLYLRYMFYSSAGSYDVYDCTGRRIELARYYVIQSLEKTRADGGLIGAYAETFCSQSG